VGLAVWEEVGWRSVEDGVADIVIGFACLEAEAGGELALGEAAELPSVIILTFCWTVCSLEKVTVSQHGQ